MSYCLRVWLQCHFHDFLIKRTLLRTYLITYWLADSATPTQYARVTRLSPAFRVRVWQRETIQTLWTSKSCRVESCLNRQTHRSLPTLVFVTCVTVLSKPRSKCFRHCEGSCDKFFHRYCAGISKGYYQDLLTSSTPFVCNFHTTILFTMDCYVSFFPIYSTEDITSSKLLWCTERRGRSMEVSNWASSN